MLLKELKWFHDLGFALHWLHKESKRPIGSEWQRGDRLTWTELKSTYKMGNNIGVRTGEPSKLKDGSYLILVDIDVKSDDPEDAKIAYSVVETFLGRKMSRCPVVVSGRGGLSRHVYCRTDKPIGSYNLARSSKRIKVFMPSVKASEKDIKELSEKDIAEGYRMRPAFEVDIYANGKQAVIPPSIHPDSKKPYRWENPIAEIKDIPNIDSSKLKAPRQIESKPFAGFVEVDLEAKNISDKTRAVIESLDHLDDYGGDRSAAVFGAISHLCTHGLTPDEIVSVLIDPLHAISEVTFDRVGSDEAAAARWLMPQIQKVLSARSPETQFGEVEDLLADTDWEQFDDPAEVRARAQYEHDKDGGWMNELARTKDKNIKVNLKNAELYIKKALNGKRWLAYNDFSGRSEFLNNPPWAKTGFFVGRPLNDDDVLKFRSYMGRNYSFDMPMNLSHDSINSVALMNTYHPVKQYLESLKWDGVKRIGTWMATYLGAKSGAYTSAVSEKFLVAAVKRIMEPGCKFDYVVILEGKQGKRKSTALRTLCAPWFCDSIGDITNKDVIGQIQGAWIVEIQELESMDKASSNAFKEFVTKQVDQGRLAYERKVKFFPRQCVLVGTTNEKEYLKDLTGNRRFWPIETQDINIDRLKKDRDQLWAEAFEEYKKGQIKVWLDDPKIEEMAIKKQREKQIRDVWADAISEWANKVKFGESSAPFRVILGSHFYKMSDIVDESLQKDYRNMRTWDHRRLGKLLVDNGFFSKKYNGTMFWGVNGESFRESQAVSSSPDLDW